MISAKIVIPNPLGLHLRPISVLCNRAIQFKSSVYIQFGGKSVNGKSVIGALSACIRYNDEIELICDGEDEEEALAVLTQLFEDGLGDEIVKK